MAWRPLPAAYRVMAQLPECRVMLLSFAGSRQEAVQMAKEWANQYEEQPSGKSADGAAVKVRAVSIYVERWVGSLQTGCWEVLPRSAGGFYRRLRSPAARQDRGPRQRDNLYGRRRADHKRALRHGNGAGSVPSNTRRASSPATRADVGAPLARCWR
jgi:hypothetical protein